VDLRINKNVDLVGKIFGRLTVLEHVGKDKNNNNIWLCECSCSEHNRIIVPTKELNNGHAKSCSCLSRDMARERFKKYNKYNLNGEYGIGYTFDDREFWFDKDDYEKIKNCYWFFDKKGYVVTNMEDTVKSLHQIILNNPNKIYNEVDHKDRIKMDNRKESLRYSTAVENRRNASKRSNNTSGVIGVYWHKINLKWIAQIVPYKGKTKNLGSFDDIEEATICRLKAELKYFGNEYAPQRHLFEQYGII
jgi:hypothetical protein